MKYKSLEKIGFYNKKKTKNKLLSLLNKILLCTIIGLVSMILIKKNPSFSNFIKNDVLKDNISFAYIKKIYNKYLGDILPEKKDKEVSVFNEKIDYIKKEKYLNGYKLEVSDNYLVPVLNDGIVVYIGEKENYGNIIIIEQSDGTSMWYGNINSSIKLYDYVKKGSFLGEANKSLILVMEKDGEYLDIENIIL